MVTYFNKKDLVSFGNYLMSDKRKALILNNIERCKEENITIGSFKEVFEEVSHSDIMNWKDSLNKG